MTSTKPRLVLLLFSLWFMLIPLKPTYADAEEAADIYRQAQELKRDHQFDDARVMFDTVTDIEDSGPWGELAADELRYGLPMFEADYWMVQFGRSSQYPAKQDTYRENAKSLYEEIISQNTDKPERIELVQHKLDQLATSSAYLKTSREFRLRNSLAPFRMALLQYFNEYGKWPDEDWIRKELGRALKMGRFAEDKLVIDDYWSSEADFRLHLMDHENDTLIKLVAVNNGRDIQIE
ncbi:MAG: hypothetical protein ACWGOV_09390 [Acidiferrobacterales bacterium]